MITQFISRSINRLLQQDPDTKEKLKRLENKVLTLTCRLPIPITLQCTVKHHDVSIQLGDHLMADTKITGTPLQLFRAGLLTLDHEAHQLDDVSIEGDMELAENWLRLLREADIDFEEMLATHIGDVPAHQAHNVITHLKTAIQKNLSAFQISTYDYLHEESDWFPTKEALSEFFDEVDKIRLDTDRLDAHIVFLKKQLKDKL